MALLETMKKVAEQSQNANVPAAFLFGNVTATSPLTIRVTTASTSPAKRSSS